MQNNNPHGRHPVPSRPTPKKINRLRTSLWQGFLGALTTLSIVLGALLAPTGWAQATPTDYSEVSISAETEITDDDAGDDVAEHPQVSEDAEPPPHPESSLEVPDPVEPDLAPEPGEVVEEPEPDPEPEIIAPKEYPEITVDLIANWDSTASAVAAPGEQVLAYLVVNANDIATGTVGTHDFTVVIQGVNAGFATWARGTVADGGRTLTVPFTEFSLATSERFGFSLIGDGNGDMSAIVQVNDSEGHHVATAELPPLPVLAAAPQWDATLGMRAETAGSIQDQFIGLLINLTIDRNSSIPVGDITFDITFDDVNVASATVPAGTRFRFNGETDTRIAFPVVARQGDQYAVAGGSEVYGYLSQTPTGFSVRIPANDFNPFQAIPRTQGSGGAIDPEMRIFATLYLEFVTDQISTPFESDILFAANLQNAWWGQMPETDRGITTTVGGELTVNNRVAIMFGREGSFSSGWGAHGWDLLWGEDAASPWDTTVSLQTSTAKYTTAWAAADFVPYGSEVMSQAHTVGSGYVANCIAIDPTVTPFQGRVIVQEFSSRHLPMNVRLWASTAPVGDLVGVDCHTLDNWVELEPIAHYGNHAFFDLPDPAQVTAIRAKGQTNVLMSALHTTRMATPREAGWMTGRGWWPATADVTDHRDIVLNSEGVIAPTPGQLFNSTNGTRDLLWGNYGFPRIVKTASNTTPEFGETVTFTIRAVNVSNMGTMPLVVHDEMDARLQFVPGSVRFDGEAAPDPAQTELPDHLQMVFDLGELPVNQIVTITYEAVASWDAGTVLNAAWMEPSAAAQQSGFAGINERNGTLSQVALHRQLTGTFELSKEPARQIMGANVGELEGTAAAQNAWLLSLANRTSAPAHSVVLDIFPFEGDGRGTTNVSHRLESFSTDHPLIVYYTIAEPSTIDPDPWVAANANRDEPDSIWLPWEEFAAGQARDWESDFNPTALLMVTALPIGSGTRANYQIGFTGYSTRGEQGSFVNYAWQRDQANQLRLVRAAVTVSEFPEITVEKTIGGRSELEVPAQTPQTVDFVLTNTGTEPLTALTFQDETLVGPEITDLVFADGWLWNDDGYLAHPETGELLWLAPGESVTATGVLPGMPDGEWHRNVVQVSATSTITATEVFDDDPLVVRVETPPVPEVVPPPPPLVVPPTLPAPPPPPVPTQPALAYTGANAWLLVVSALIGTGGVSALFPKSRRHQTGG